MQLSNKANFELQELRELISSESYGSAIDIEFRGHRYTFSAEDNHILVNVESENVGYIYFHSYDKVKFEDWDREQNKYIEWLDELDAHLYEYIV